MPQGQVETAGTSEERRAHHEMAMRLVRQFPDPALRTPAAAVEGIDDELRRLTERMADIMERSHGVGLAATQLGVMLRVLVYRLSAEDEPRVVVNPELADLSDDSDVDTEGCLSLLGGELQVPVERSLRLVLTGMDERGQPVRVEAEGFEARVLQHEVDHLNGVMIIDRASKEDRRTAMRELRLRA
ncbi:MAG: peptide deformylase [Gaiellales bacterium]